MPNNQDGYNAGVFVLAHSTPIARMMRDANTLSAAAFCAKYGFRLRNARATVSRLMDISGKPEHKDEAIRLARILQSMLRLPKGRIR